MDRRRTLYMTLALLLAFSGLLLAHPPVFGDRLSLEETYAPWKERIRVARAELDGLKAKRQNAQAVHDDILSQWRVRGSRVDPEKEAQASAAVKELDQLIRDKEYEITATILEQARHAGVPSGVLSQ
jgi:hypothetical protein